MLDAVLIEERVGNKTARWAAAEPHTIQPDEDKTQCIGCCCMPKLEVAMVCYQRVYRQDSLLFQKKIRHCDQVSYFCQSELLRMLLNSSW